MKQSLTPGNVSTVQSLVFIRKLTMIVIPVALSWCAKFPVQTQENFIDRSHHIKAAYLYNFGKYVSWPRSASGDQFVIGIVGSSPLQSVLTEAARTKTISGRKIRVEQVESVEQARRCNLLYFPQGQKNPLFEPIARTVQGMPNLLVGEQAGFAHEGGMINFYMENNRVKFEINTDQAKQGGLSISSKLLRLGRSVNPLSVKK